MQLKRGGKESHAVAKRLRDAVICLIIRLILRSFSTSALVTPRTARATIGDRAFPSAAASVWNSLPESVLGSPTLPVFRNRLKTELFARSFS